MKKEFYKIDFKKLAVLLLPTFLRKRKTIALLKVLVSPIQTLHSEFIKQRSNDLEKLAYNGQVCFLRKALNDKFDPTYRRIEITDGGRETPQYIYTDAEEKPIILETMYLHSNSVYADTGIDFCVLLPLELYDQYKKKIAIGEYRLYEIEAVVDFYRLASKRYVINTK